MSAARRWLSERAARLEHRPRLEDALLGEAPMRYAVHRLRYTMIRAVVRTAFRIAELAVFTLALPFEVLAPVLFVRSVLLVGESLWWGALETLRRDVRSLSAQDRSPVRVIRQWLLLASLVAILTVLSSLVWVCSSLSPFEGFDVVDAFVLACAARFGMDVLARAHHSGVYGIVRVYRPVWSLLVVDLADVVLLIGAWFSLGAWGFGLSFLATGLLRTSLSVAFTRRTYAELRLRIGGFRRWLLNPFEARWSPRHTFASAVGNAVAQVDALLVLGLAFAPGDGALLLAALFHGVAPLQAAAFAWSRPFYFDFKRLEGWGSPFLLRRFEVFLGRLALLVPLPVGLVTLVLLGALWRGPFWVLSIELLALAAVRARLSLLHVHAFSLSDHAFLAKLFLGMMLVASVTPMLGSLPPELSVGAVALLAWLSLLVLGRSRKALHLASRDRSLALPAWLEAVSSYRGSVCLGVARVDRRLSSLGKLMRVLAPELSGASLVRIARDTFAWFAPAEQAKQFSPSKLVEAGAGALKELELGAPAASGREALRAGLPNAEWQRHLGSFVERGEREAIDFAWFDEALRRIAPSARCIELRGLDGSDVAGYPVRAVRRLILSSARGRTGFTRIGTTEAAVLSPGGEPRVLVLVPSASENAATWKSDTAELLRSAEVSLSLAASNANLNAR